MAGQTQKRDSILDHHNAVANQINATIGFLKTTDAPNNEELYAFRYNADVPFPLTNMETEFLEIPINDIRGMKDKASLDTHGFEIRELRSSMSYEQFEDEQDVQQIYCEDIKKQLREDFGAVEIDLPRVRIRRRHASFPISIGRPFGNHQPSTAAHIDVTSKSAKDKVEEHRGVDAVQYLQRPYKIVNVWKPLFGPLEDWPLAFCDVRTVDKERDIAETTIIHEKYMNHNCHVCYNATQQWYYLSNQRADELLIFRQYDSAKPGNNGAPHSSFRHPTTPCSARTRESIEIMAILYLP